MNNAQEHECVIGMRNDYENTELVTLAELKEHIKNRLERDYNSEYNYRSELWLLSKYCDKRYSTDLTRFKFCPLCGKKIDWKAIKGGADG